MSKVNYTLEQEAEHELHEYEAWKAKSARRRSSWSQTPNRLRSRGLRSPADAGPVDGETVGKRATAGTMGPPAASLATLDLAPPNEPPQQSLKAVIPDGNVVKRPIPVRVAAPTPLPQRPSEEAPRSEMRQDSDTGSGVRQGGDYDSLLTQLQQVQKGREKAMNDARQASDLVKRNAEQAAFFEKLAQSSTTDTAVWREEIAHLKKALAESVAKEGTSALQLTEMQRIKAENAELQTLSQRVEDQNTGLELENMGLKKALLASKDELVELQAQQVAQQEDLDSLAQTLSEERQKHRNQEGAWEQERADWCQREESAREATHTMQMRLTDEQNKERKQHRQREAESEAKIFASQVELARALRALDAVTRRQESPSSVAAGGVDCVVTAPGHNKAWRRAQMLLAESRDAMEGTASEFQLIRESTVKIEGAVCTMGALERQRGRWSISEGVHTGPIVPRQQVREAVSSHQRDIEVHQHALEELRKATRKPGNTAITHNVQQYREIRAEAEAIRASLSGTENKKSMEDGWHAALVSVESAGAWGRETTSLKEKHSSLSHESDICRVHIKRLGDASDSIYRSYTIIAGKLDEIEKVLEQGKETLPAYKQVLTQGPATTTRPPPLDFGKIVRLKHGIRRVSVQHLRRFLYRRTLGPAAASIAAWRSHSVRDQRATAMAQLGELAAAKATAELEAQQLHKQLNHTKIALCELESSQENALESERNRLRAQVKALRLENVQLEESYEFLDARLHGEREARDAELSKARQIRNTANGEIFTLRAQLEASGASQIRVMARVEDAKIRAHETIQRLENQNVTLQHSLLRESQMASEARAKLSRFEEAHELSHERSVRLLQYAALQLLRQCVWQCVKVRVAMCVDMWRVQVLDAAHMAWQEHWKGELQDASVKQMRSALHRRLHDSTSALCLQRWRSAQLCSASSRITQRMVGLKVDMTRMQQALETSQQQSLELESRLASADALGLDLEAKATRKLTSAINDLAVTKRDQQTLAAQIGALQKERDVAQNTLQQVRGEVELLRQTMHQVDLATCQERQGAASKIDTLEGCIQTLQERNQQMENNLSEAHEEMEQVKTDLEARLDAARRAQEGMAAELESAKATCGNLEAALKGESSAKIGLEEAVAKESVWRNAAQVEIAESKAELEALQSRCASLTEELRSTAAEQAALQDTAVLHGKQLDELTRDRGSPYAASEQLQILTTELECLQRQAHSLALQHARSEQEVFKVREGAQQEAAWLEHALSAEKGKVAAAERDTRAESRKCEALQETLHRKELHIEHLRQLLRPSLEGKSLDLLRDDMRNQDQEQKH